MTHSSPARPGFDPATPRIAALCVLVTLLGLPTLAASEAAAQDLRREVPYKVKFTGELDPATHDLIKRVSTLGAAAKSPPVSDVGLRRRIRADLETVGAALRAEGYYASTLTEHIDLTESPAAVRIEVVEGPRYLIGDIAIRLIDERPTPHAVALLRSIKRPAADTPARSKVVLDFATSVLKAFTDQGYLAATFGEREFFVDHATRTLRADIELTAGTRARFGPTDIEGLVDVREDYARSLIRWQEGEYLVDARVREVSARMRATRLFDSVHVDYTPPEEGDDVSSITVTVVERDFRSIGLGLGYDSDDGVNANVFWEHRNLAGAGRSLRLSVFGNLDELGGAVAYRQPNFYRPEQSFLVDGSVATEDTKAYDADRVAASVGIERALTPRIVGRIGLGGDVGNVQSKSIEDGTNGHEKLAFLSLPTVLRYDGGNRLLGATRGVRIDLTSAPYFELFGAGAAFSKSRLTLRGYRPLSRNERWVGALRGSVGSIIGEGRSQVPIDKRFFAGGGGSIRGFEHQLAGPLGTDRGDPDEKRPTGGRSVVEAAGELRLRIGDSFGLVSFVDGGSVYESSYPDFANERFFVGAGLGGRYYSAIGPIRLDIGTPLNGRDGDDPVQVYISIGESY